MFHLGEGHVLDHISPYLHVSPHISLYLPASPRDGGRRGHVLDHLRDVFSEGVSFTQALATLISVPEPDTFDDLLRSLEQLTGDISVLRRPAGLLQLPPMRLAQ